MMKPLNNNSLSQLDSNVSVPNYDRSQLTPGILHFGVGNFHRAHEAWYLDKLFSLGEDHDWSIVGAGVKHHGAQLHKDLKTQDFLSTVVILDPEGYTASICGPMIDIVDPETSSIVDRLASPDIKIVSLTITEGGYYIDESTGGFDTQHPDIIHDQNNPDKPLSVFANLVAGLAKRRAENTPAFTIMSCDNLPGNGHIAKQAVIGMANLISEDLANWIEKEVCFPNGMVDCITPATGDREIELVRDRFNIEDNRPVVCEPFHQWVLEDKFSSGRPALEKVGVEFVEDVAPYELMKLRILNGGHATISYPAALLGIHYVHDAMAHSLVNGFLDKIIKDEVIPIVPEVSGFDFLSYFQSSKERFSNAEIGDTIPRLCMDGANRQPKFIFASINDRLNQGLPVDGLALEVALWCRYCAGVDEEGNSIEVVEDNSAQLTEYANKAKSNPAVFLELRDIFGTLSDDSVFVSAFTQALNSLWSNGVAVTLENYINSK